MLLVFSLCLSAYSFGKAEWIERRYFIRGMICGACALHIKRALLKSGLEDQQIIEIDPTSVEPGGRVGRAVLKFPLDRYKGKQTDCHIVHEIETAYPQFSVFWDKNQKEPCKKN